MNNRDPFRLRTTPHNAAALLHRGATYAVQTVNELQEKVEDLGTKLLDIDLTPERVHTSAPPDAVSHVFQRHPNGPGDGADSPKMRRNPSYQTSSVSEKLTDMFKPKDDMLPMYKDKPYHNLSRRKGPFWRRQWLLLVLVFVGGLTVISWISGLFSGTASIPRVVKRPNIRTSAATWEERREKVRDAFKLSWKSYEEHAWGMWSSRRANAGYDEYDPVHKTGKHMAEGGMGWIIVDALDTMMLMNLTTELEHAQDWIKHNLTYDKNQDVNTFETTIRMLGGLLSAHYLANDAHAGPYPEDDDEEDLYLEKASDLADRLLGAYESKSGIPFASINLSTRQGIVSHQDGGASSTAEAATLQLEMKYLSRLTGEMSYWEAAEKVMKVIDDNGAEDGLVPIFIYADKGEFRENNIRLGSRGDSYYEYLIKQYLQTSEQEPVYNEMWQQALAGVKKHLITYGKHSNLSILGERPNGLDHALFPKMDHLVCFMPGTIALGVTKGKTLAHARQSGAWTEANEDDMTLAAELMKTCWAMYKVTATGLSPEIAHFHVDSPAPLMADGVRKGPELSDDPNAAWRKDFDIHANDYHNLQRPETVESLFYMWRITGDPVYREWGWTMFEAFVQHTLVADGSGFSSIGNVGTVPPPMRNNMESFWLAETLKYFWLLFGPDDVLPLDTVVFNTEAHPLPRFELSRLFKTGWARKARDAHGYVLDAAEVAADAAGEPAAAEQPVLGPGVQ